MTTYLIVTRDHKCHEVEATCALGAIAKVCSAAKCCSTEIIMLHAKQSANPTNPTNQKV